MGERDALRALLGLVAEHHLNLAVVELGEHIVFQASKRQVGLGEEVARAARGVEELEAGELLAETAQGVLPLARRHALLRADGIELFLQAVQEQRVYHLVDVLGAGVVHAARAAGLRVQGGLEDAAEDGGADLRPVGLLGHLEQELELDLVGEVGDLGFLREQPPVDVGEGLDRLVVGVALVDRSVERLEEPLECHAHVLRLDVPQVVQERVLGEELRVLAEQAEHQAHAQDVEGLLALLGLGVDVLRLQQGVQLADEAARLHRDLLLALGSAVGGVGDEVKQVRVPPKLLQGELDVLARELGAGARVAVVHAEGGEVAHHHEARLAIAREALRVGEGLLEGRDHAALALLGLVQIDV